MIVSKNISAKEVRTLKDAEILTATPLTTASGYADVVGSLIDAANYSSIAFVIKNTGGTNGATWKPVASIDGVTFVDATTEANLALGVATAYTESPAKYRYYKIQAKDQSSGDHTTVAVSVIGK